MFSFQLSDELKTLIKKLKKKHPGTSTQIQKKITEIISSDTKTIDRYYNCKYGLKQYKHCHIDKSFVLLFKVDKNENFILFARFGHHDDFFKK